MRLKDKVCLVTGGGRGIGRTMVELFASQGALKVYAGDLDTNELAATLPGKTNIECLELDVTDTASIKAAVAHITAREGRIDVLVNNAGVTRDALVNKMSDDDWATVININLNGVFFMTREVAPVMLENGSGSIINLSSVVGIDGNIGQTNYAATKGGVVAMAKSWAKELARKGAQIRSNAIAPGYIKTPMTESVPEKVIDLIVSKTVLGRLGSPEDIADCALFLASDESSFITGQVIRVDGGLVL